MTKIQGAQGGSVALTVGVVRDLAVARRANPGLHGRRGPPAE